MTWTVARKEIVSNLLSYKFFIVVLLIVVLTFTSFFIMHRDFKGRFSDYQLVRPKPGDPAAIVAPNPLSVFAKGLDESLTRYFDIQTIGVYVRSGQKSGNAVFSFFPAPDFLYIVRVVLSLVALLFGFDQVSREKEQGTLKLMLSNSVSRARILAGKWIGNYLSLAVPFLIISLLGILFLSLDPAIHFSAGQTGRLILILAVSLIYIAFFLSLGILISTLTRRTVSSLVILLFLWAVLVFIIPNLGTLLARQMVRVPSVKALSEKKEQTWTREILLSMLDSKAMKGEGTGPVVKKHLQTIGDEFDKLEEDYRGRFARLVRFSKNINRISPAASFVYAVTDIAGTGIGEEMNLKGEVIRYKDSLLQTAISSFATNKPHAPYPSFRYEYRPLTAVLAQGALFDFAWLIFFNLLFFVLSYFALVRYDVR